jgi:hypothetical protein
MADYRDAFRASLERVDQLQRDLVRAHSGDDVLALKLENELLRLDREWRDKQGELAHVEGRRQKVLKIVSSILFLVLALTGIALLSMGMTIVGMVCFAASVAGWVLAGLQDSRHARLIRLYQDDRERVDHTLNGVRVAIGDIRSRVAPAEPNEPEELESATETEDVSTAARPR